MQFEWDANKNKSNFQKHGLSFEDAYLVFGNPVLTVEDKRKDYGEIRYGALGILMHRVISMRKANAQETKSYQERLEKN